MKKAFFSVMVMLFVITMIVSLLPVSVSAAPVEVPIKQWGPDLIGDTRDNNPAAVGHNCGNPAKDGLGNVIGWEAVQNPEKQEEMFNHMIFGCEEFLNAGDYVFEVRMKISNLDPSHSDRFFNIDIYCANHASYLGNLSLTRSVITSKETDVDGYAIYRLEFTVDSKHSGELLEARIHFSNACDAIVTNCAYIQLDSSVEMDDVVIPLDETVTENATVQDGKVMTDPQKPGYIVDGFVTNALPEGQLYMKMIFGLEQEIPEMKNSSNVFRFEVLDVTGGQEEKIEELVFTGRDFKFESGDLWTANQLYTLVMPFKVKEDMVGKDLKFRVYGYGTNNGRLEPYVFSIHQLLIADNGDIYDDPNKPKPEIYEFKANTVTGDILGKSVTYDVYKANDTALENKLYSFSTDAKGDFTITTEKGYFWLVKKGTTTPYIYFTVDDGETANFSIIQQELEDKEIFTPPEEFDPESIKDIPEDERVEEMPEGTVNQAGTVDLENTVNTEAEPKAETGVEQISAPGNAYSPQKTSGNNFTLLYVLVPVLAVVAVAAIVVLKKVTKKEEQ